MVRMAQDFSMRLELIDGQGNFGSMDGDPPAAMRYTEVRLARAAHEVLDDIDRETVDFQPNYDDSLKEPVILPAKFPNLLVNGAGGIAVGMATNIPTHNLGEVIDAGCALLDDPALPDERLLELVPGPDFPTGGIVIGRGGLRQAYETGHGSIVIRGRAHIEEIRKDREAIVITEIPYQVNKARMIEKIAELVRDKRIDGIADLRDESDRDGVRVVVELKRDAMSEIVLNQLYRYSPLQTTFGVNMLALNAGRPEMMNLRNILAAFIAFREEVITRRTVFELKKARERAHTLVGLAIAVANIDAVIGLIRAAPDPQAARERLMARDWAAADVGDLVKLIEAPGNAIVDGRCRLTEDQAKAILDLRLQRLTGLERDKIADELRELAGQIRDYLDILGSRDRVRRIMKDELLKMQEEFATPRKTTLEDIEVGHDIEDLIQREDMVVTVTHGGYIKRVPLSSYRAQRRGGKGRSGMTTKEEDFLSRVFVCDTHTPVLFFSSRGLAYRLKVYRLPEGAPQARGKALVNLLPLIEGEAITTVMPMPEDEATWQSLDIMFATASGHVRRNRLSDFTNIHANGKIAMKLAAGDRLVGAMTCTEADDALLAARSGKCIRFPVPQVRVFSGRTSMGVRGIKLDDGDEIISMSMLRHVEAATEERDAYVRLANARRRAEDEPAEGNGGGNGHMLDDARIAWFEGNEQFVLSVTENGFGKRTSAYEYRITNRGGTGITNIDTSERNGRVVASFPVGHADQIMLVTDAGMVIRCPVDDIRIAGRRTQGVTLFQTAEGQRVVSVTRVAEDDNGGPPSNGELAHGGQAEAGARDG
jgi:DNA gyrase subunit A